MVLIVKLEEIPIGPNETTNACFRWLSPGEPGNKSYSLGHGDAGPAEIIVSGQDDQTLLKSRFNHNVYRHVRLASESISSHDGELHPPPAAMAETA